MIEAPSNPVLEAMYSEFDCITKKGNKLELSTNGIFLYPTQPDLIRDINNKVILRGGMLSEYYELIRSAVCGLIMPTEELLKFTNNKKQTETKKPNLFARIFKK